MNPSQAAQQFRISGRLVLVNSFGRGNVNDTYEAVFRNGGSVSRVVLQRINRRVFAHPEWIMANMRLVTDHVNQALEREHANGAGGREWGFPRVVEARDGHDFLIDEGGGFWRCLTMIEGATSFDKVKNAEHALEAGTVLGCFHRLISDIDSSKIHDTLPGFHNCPAYFARYQSTVANGGSGGRMTSSPEVRRLLRFVNARAELSGVLENARSRGELTARLIHGDPKADNIMIDDFTGMGIGIVDLDTVKPGLIHYDFGDAVRSICNPAGEDAADLRQVVFDVELCRAFVKGYMSHAGDFLTQADRAYLFDSVRLIAFELGLRFFEDYLAGDVYFKVRFEEHNLNRARVQFKLCESIEANEPGIRAALNA